MPLIGSPPAAHAAPTCGGRPASIVGTEAADTLAGTDGADVIAGLGGDDPINGLGGNAVICGESTAMRFMDLFALFWSGKSTALTMIVRRMIASA